MKPSAETRGKLLKAATATIAVNGYNAASLEDIAAAAGLTKGAVYSQFSSKTGLLVALTEEWSSYCVSRLERGGAPTRAIAGFVSYRPRGLRWLKLVPEFWRLAVDDAAVAPALHEAYGRIRLSLLGVVASFDEPSRAGATADEIIALHDGLIVIATLRGVGDFRRTEETIEARVSSILSIDVPRLRAV